MRVYKLFLKSKSSYKFTYLTDFNDLEFDTVLSLVKTLYVGSKILIECKFIK